MRYGNLRTPAGTSVVSATGRRKRGLIPLVAAMALVLAGCGGTDDTVDEGDEAGTDATEESPDTDTDAGGDGADPAEEEDDGEDESEGSDDSAEADPVVVRVAESSSSLAHLTFQVAMANDLFKEEGIEIESVGVFNASPPTIAAVVSGEADVGSPGATTAMDAMQEGVPLKVLSTTTAGVQELVLSTDAVEQLEEEGVTVDSPVEEKVQALSGLTIGTTSPGSSNFLTLRGVLADFGVDPDSDVEVQPSDPQAIVQGIREGLYDGGFVSLGAMSANVADGSGVQWLNQAAGEIPGWSEQIAAFYVVTETYAEENYEAVQRFASVMQEASKIAVDESTTEEARDNVREEYFPEFEEEQFNVLWETAREAIVPDGKVSKDGFSEFQEIAQKTTETDYSDLEYEDVFLPEGREE